MKRLWTGLLSALLALALAVGAAAEPTAEPSPTPAPYALLARGMSGESVTALQRALIEAGYLQGDPDGSFGSMTERAVEAYQAANGLYITGVADADTRAMLLTGEVADADGVKEPLRLTRGSTGEEVYIVQALLYRWGFLTDEPDGSFGAATQTAMQRFMEYARDDMLVFAQERQEAEAALGRAEPSVGAWGMEAVVDVPLSSAGEDGVVTDDWYAFMLEAFDGLGEAVRLDDKNADVARMQRRLSTLKYVAGGLDGYFGAHTQVALMYFQKRNNLDQSGVCDESTQRALFSSAATPSDRYVSQYMAKVSTDKNKVYIYRWTGDDYTELVKTFKCSTGARKTPTIKGTFQAVGRAGDWYYMDDANCWVRYAFVIQGNYFFHSVLYSSKGGKPTKSSVRNLGKSVSHGCIRMAVDDIKWIYDNCANGMTVEIV